MTFCHDEWNKIPTEIYFPCHRSGFVFFDCFPRWYGLDSSALAPASMFSSSTPSGVMVLLNSSRLLQQAYEVAAQVLHKLVLRGHAQAACMLSGWASHCQCSLAEDNAWDCCFGFSAPCFRSTSRFGSACCTSGSFSTHFILVFWQFDF